MNAADKLLRLLYPPKCVLCGVILDEEQTDLCPRCRRKAPECTFRRKKSGKRSNVNIRFLDSITAVWYYEGNVRNAIRRFKFHRRAHLSEGLGRMLAMRLAEAFPEGVDCITWVPVSTLRRMQRGYDQAELLARAVGRELRLPVRRLLRKTRHTVPQSGLSTAAERRANVRGAFSPQPGASAEGLRVLLTDDVLTTGATASECARVLRDMGVKSVDAAMLAISRKFE